MATEAKKPKGILKKPPAPAADAKAETKAREVATQHAQIIHHRRGFEDQITDSLIALSDFPLQRGPAHGAASPSPSDVSAFLAGVRLFQPSDYDDLIEERNANGLCGYALCPRPRTRVAGSWKLVNWGSKDFNIVPKKEIERWCSQACARRAMYVKVQLNETAAWERAGIESIHIDLYEEPQKKQAEDDPADRLAKELEALKVDGQRKAVKDAKELALERGDTGEKAKTRPVDVTIQEKTVTSVPEEPSLERDADGHLMLEGYKTKFDSQPTGEADDDSKQQTTIS
jgi:hypothetical protein